MKTTTSQLHKFINEGWPEPKEDWYMDDLNEELWATTFSGDDYTPKDPCQIIKIEDFDASMLYQGKDPEQKNDVKSLSSLFKKWVKAQTTMSLVITFPKEREAAVRALLAKENISI